MDPIAFHVPGPVAGAIAALGRTEDIAFSPSNGRLAIAAYARNACLILDLRVESRAILGFVEITSFALDQPHGLAFLDEDTLVVANRAGKVCLFALPAAGQGARISLAPLQTLHGALRDRIRTPGSLVVRDLGNGRHAVLVCNNYRHRVTRHVVDARARFRTQSNRTLIARQLDTPDGIDVSPDGRWIAVSNHMTGSVLIFEDTPDLGPDTEPAGALLGIGYPHGVRFSASGDVIVVADAGKPSIHAFRRAGRDWHGTAHRHTARPIMNRELFERGRHNPEEGGPKGIAVDRRMRLVVATSEHQPLAFFDLGEMLSDLA